MVRVRVVVCVRASDWSLLCFVLFCPLSFANNDQAWWKHFNAAANIHQGGGFSKGE